MGKIMTHTTGVLWSQFQRLFQEGIAVVTSTGAPFSWRRPEQAEPSQT